MADEADRATESAQVILDAHIGNSRRPVGPVATGFCLHCDTDLPEGVRWCNADCRDDWERDQR